jgi:hypothetical protein
LEDRTLFSSTSALVPTFSSTTLAQSIASGATARGEIGLNLSNPTAAEIKGKSTLQLFASSDGAIDSSSIVLAKISKSLDVKPSAFAPATLQVKISGSELPVGDYTLLARILDSSGGSAVSTSGPALKITPPVMSLSASVVRFAAPSTVIAGEPLHTSIVMRVTNTGTTLAKSSAAVPFSTDIVAIGPVVGSFYQPIVKSLNLAPGRSTVISVPLKAVSFSLVPGMYQLAPYVDLSAAAYTPQTYSIAVESPTVTLTPVFSKLSIPGSVVAGAAVHGSAVLRITNGGNITSQIISPGAYLTDAAGTTTISLVLSPADGTTPTPIATLSKTLRVRAGASTSVTIPIKQIPSVPAGSYMVEAIVTDANGQVSMVSSETVVVTG